MEHDLEAIRAYEAELIAYTEAKLRDIEYLHILGRPSDTRNPTLTKKNADSVLFYFEEVMVNIKSEVYYI